MLAICTSLSVTTGSANACRPRVEQAAVAANAIAAAANAILFFISLLRSFGVTVPTRLRAGTPPQLLPPGDPLRDFLFERKRPRLVEPRAVKRIRQILLRDICLRGVMRVLVPLSISQFLHQTGGSIPDVQGYRLGRIL